MKRALTSYLLFAALFAAGCFQPVVDDSADASGSADAGCRIDSDCPQPQSSACDPVAARCSNGVCVTEKLPRVWDSSPGACQQVSDCDCQASTLGAPNCTGAFACEAGRCQFKCDSKSCQSDQECGAGFVCDQDTTCSGAKTCVPGCRGDVTGNGCPAGQACAPRNACTSCSCPGFCISPPKPCQSDLECPGPGQICAPTDTACSATSKRCVPGCDKGTPCPNGQFCAIGACGAGTCQNVGPGCVDDKQCPAGQVCEFDIGCATPKKCVPGCHSDSQCSSGTCNQRVCVTCPCAGTCGLDPCRDQDGDGYGADCSPAADLCSNLIGKCDCDDTNPKVHPGAPEICGNGIDDNCNGQVDEGCGTCSRSCASTFDCGLGTAFCQSACCQSCPTLPPQSCPAGGCSQPNGIDIHGCAQAPICGKCCACPAMFAPVCGTNYQTYSNPCEAQCAAVPVLHSGVCLKGEGLECSPASPCVAGMYCRDTCPMCGALLPMRCTQLGACTADYDCPAGLTPPQCPRGPATFACANHSCQAACP